MSQFKHFIITQFNLRLWSKDKLNRSTYTDEWLSKRFSLFDKYCFPSVLQQNNKNFIWLCLFDKGTDEKYLSAIESYKERCPQMVTCFLDESDTSDWLKYTKGVMNTYLDQKPEYIVSTNLDNDDAIAHDFVDTIHSMIVEKPQEVVYSFNWGYQYFTDRGILLKMSYPHNHFLTLVEKYTSEYKTIKNLPHAKVRKYYKTIDIKSKPFWIEFVHATNVNNDLRITSRIKYLV